MATYQQIQDEIAENAKAFGHQLHELASYFEGEAELVIQKSCFMLFEKIVERTPRRTGAAAANWQISTQDNDGASEERTDVNANITAQKNIFFNQRVNNIVWIVNNLDYISILEDGRQRGSRGMRGSERAPGGMVRISLVEFTEYLRMAVAGHKGLEVS